MLINKRLFLKPEPAAVVETLKQEVRNLPSPSFDPSGIYIKLWLT